MQMYTERELKDGARIYFAKPTQALAPTIIDAVAQVITEVSGIVEAHLPQYFAEGDATARLVLVIGVSRESDIPNIIPTLAAKLKLALPPGQGLEILPYETDALPDAVRATATCIK